MRHVRVWCFWVVMVVLVAGFGLKTAVANPAGGPTYEEQIVEIVNQERWNNGQLPPLKSSPLLDSSSETHSTNMANRDFFAHCDVDTKKKPWDRMTDVGYNWNYAGENIAVGYSTPTSVMNGWMNSSGHRANILSINYREIGVGYVYQSNDQGNIRQDTNGDCNADGRVVGPYYSYWTQNFGRRSNVYPVVINREAYETTSRNVNLYMYGDGWAQSMRFRNENGTWSAWMAYTPDVAWTLSSGNGVKTVNAEISSGANGSGTVLSASDTIVLNEAIVSPVIVLAANDVGFTAVPGDTAVQQQTVTFSNSGTQSMTWAAAEQVNQTWLSLSPTSGTTTAGGSSNFTVTVNPSGLGAGVYTAVLEISSPEATNSPQLVTVILLVTNLHVYLPAIMTP